ncbi:MAG: DNA gyrase subunit A [Candidatus Ozemobacter sibiricus]|jgi:DNA gyrase subunit A|uniref:DNA gyrase subunit A n=1 Tax=Candidatus Ozemobacter sibiricus TaxID=2268124 RepID=A0A367ZKU1_9BACT|nr:MAG: DNA gyrase subunit A [Candidatus Ozemobacter sibiricus]
MANDHDIDIASPVPGGPPTPPTEPPSSHEQFINIEDDMKSSYLDYAMSVIIGRALPDVRDGLKPVHRRVLYAMFDNGFTSKRPYVKAARTVGEVLGKYHPHGDAAVYDTLVRMAQDFSLRYPLIDGHGNFGSIDGDAPAAMRYTEARLGALAEELLRDLEMETVDWMPNFDGSLQEPVVLPCKFPNLLVNGSAGIAVGMATNIPPHNLGEVIDGLMLLLDNPETSIDDLIKAVPAPDFPTGGLIMGREGAELAYRTGRGSVVMRAVVDVEEMSKGRERLVVKELPYQVNKAKLVKSIADLIREKKLDGVTDLRDESNREGIRIVIELRKGTNTEVILNQLYRHTALQQTFGIIMLVLVDNRPVVLDLKALMEHYINHCRDVIRRRTAFQLRKAEEKAHILEGLTIALDNLDAVITLIKEAAGPSEAKQGLMDTFMLSEKQAQAILDMRLQRLTGLEREKIVQEYHETLALIEKLKGILASDEKVRDIIKEELKEIREKFADPRRTRISESEAERLEIEDLMQEQDIIITVTRNGYVKRIAPSAFRQIGRGSKGSLVGGIKEDDVVEHMFLATTHSYLLVFTSTGKAHWLKGYKIPEGGRQATGRAIVNLLNLAENEKITALLPVRHFDQTRRIFMVTRRGVAKMTELAAFSRPTSKGIIAINLDEGDELVGVKTLRGGEQIVIATRNGYAIRFPENEVRVMGRAARGVKAITFRSPDDVVIGMEVFARKSEEALAAEAAAAAAATATPAAGTTTAVEGASEPASSGVNLPPPDEADLEEAGDTPSEEPEADEVAGLPPAEYIPFEGKLMTVTTKGYGKQTDINAYRVTHRGGKGVINLKIREKTGEVLAIKRMFERDELMIVSRSGKVVRLNADTVRATGRAASGVKLITLEENDQLISVARIPATEEKVD